jgi:NAD(P)-dependent dehydrogenase (short-subunit alcohol dehydrogenase family)
MLSSLALAQVLTRILFTSRSYNMSRAVLANAIHIKKKKGINLAFARLLLSKGCSVLIADLQLRPESQALLDQYLQQTSSSSNEANNKEPFAVFHETNVASWPQLTSLWSKALSIFPTVDIVVPGAGLFEPQWSSFWDAPRTATNPDTASRDPADAETGHYAVLDVNLTHPIRLSQLAIGHWTQRRQKGCIVFIGSIAGYTSAISTPIYFASKHGLHGFVRSLGGLRDTLGIRVGCVAPGSVRVRPSVPPPLPLSSVPPSLRVPPPAPSSEFPSRSSSRVCHVKLIKRLLSGLPLFSYVSCYTSSPVSHRPC